MSSILILAFATFGHCSPLMRRDGARTEAEAALQPDVASAVLAEVDLTPAAVVTTDSEADRLRQQFDVLDSSFAHAASAYMQAAIDSQLGSKDSKLEPNAKSVPSTVEMASAHGKQSSHVGNVGANALKAKAAGEQETQQKAKKAYTAVQSELQSQVEKSEKGPASHSGSAIEDKDVYTPGKAQSLTAQRESAVPYGFYIHAFFEAAAVVNQLRSIRKYYPEAPVYVMTDGGANFSGICEQIGNCKFRWYAPAHDCWNPKPFLDRFHEAAEWLESNKAESTIFLEPDVTLHRRAVSPLKPGVAAGGLYDMWNAQLPVQLREKTQELGRRFSGNENFTISWSRFGLAGGSIIRTKAALVSFKPDRIDWPSMEKLYSKEVYSSDIAMLIALASHGFDYYPWEEVSQGHDEYQPKHETAFKHHSSGEPGGKPFYGKSLAEEDVHLVGPPPADMRPPKLGQCQSCVWAEEKDCWPRTLGGKSENQHIECPTDTELFRKKIYVPEDPQPHLFKV